MHHRLLLVAAGGSLETRETIIFRGAIQGCVRNDTRLIAVNYEVRKSPVQKCSGAFLMLFFWSEKAWKYRNIGIEWVLEECQKVYFLIPVLIM